VPDNFGSGPGPRDRNPNDTISTALSNANQSVQTTAATDSDRRSQQQAQAQPQPQPSAFDQFLNGTFPFGAADFAKLAFLRNSVATTVNELSNLNLQRATATYNGPVVALINGNRMDGTYQRLELRQSQWHRHHHGRQRHVWRRKRAEHLAHQQHDRVPEQLAVDERSGRT
jgi:hypothetical protein